MTPKSSKSICKVEGCDRPVLVQFCQLCRHHYVIANRDGTVRYNKQPPGATVKRKLTKDELRLFEDNLDVCEKLMRAMKVDSNYFRSVALTAMMAAAQDWDNDGTASFSTYAWTRIRFAILNYKRNDEFIFGKGVYDGMLKRANAGEELHPSERVMSIDFLHDNGVQIDRTGKIVTSQEHQDPWDD